MDSVFRVNRIGRSVVGAGRLSHEFQWVHCRRRISFVWNADIWIVGIPTEKNWRKLIAWVIGAVLFFFAVVGVMVLSHLDQSAERFGELTFTALIAMSLGMFWLIRGWTLIVQGITPSRPVGVEDPVPEQAGRGVERVTHHFFSDSWR